MDRGLLAPDGQSESQSRQAIYAKEIPAEIFHLVKAPQSSDSRSRTLQDGGVTVCPIPVRHWVLFPLSAARRGATLLRDREFDLIQVQEPLISGLAGLYLARRYRLPLIAGAFTDQIVNPAWVSASAINRMANIVGKFVYRHCDAIRVDSLAVTQRLHASGFLHARFVPFMITNADRLVERDQRTGSIRRALLGDREGPLLLAVARLEREKNVGLMLQAVGRVKRDFPGVVLAVAGDGSLRKELECNAPQGMVKWLGWMPNAELVPYYQAADLTLLSSDIESSARVLTESLLAGTPVLTTDTAGAREVIEDGYSGRIVPVKDAEAYTQALLDLCRRSEWLKEMGQRGQIAVLRQAGNIRVVSGLRDLFADVIRKGASESAVV